MSDLYLLHHIEEYIGEIDGAWNEDAEGSKLPFKVLKFLGKPAKTAITLCTLGLSEHVLKQIKGDVCRQELIFCCYERCFNEYILTLLVSIGEQILSHGEAVARGQVLVLDDSFFHESFFSDSKLSAL